MLEQAELKRTVHDNFGEMAKVTPEAVMVYYLDEIAGRLKAIQKHLDSTIAKGHLMPYIQAVTDQRTELNLGDWLSVTIHNDGASAVYVLTDPGPVMGLHAPLNSADDLTIDKKSTKAQKLYFVCAAGGTASVRMWVLY